MSDWIKERVEKIARLPVSVLLNIEEAMREAQGKGQDEANKRWEEALRHIMQPSFLARYDGKQRMAIHKVTEHLRERCAGKEAKQ